MDRFERLRDRVIPWLIHAIEFMWIAGIVLNWLAGMVRAWRLLYAGRQAAAFWTMFHVLLPGLMIGAFFYTLYRTYAWAHPKLVAWHPEVDWPEASWRWPWEPREEN